MSKVVKPKSRLGRGLSSLISVTDLPVEVEVPPSLSGANAGPPPALTTSGTVEIPLDQITPNPHQPRREMNEAGIAELAASIKTTGLIQPIVIRRTDAGFQLIAGERRLRAARLAGLPAIPALIRDVDSFTQAQMALVENIQREDLNPIDRAHSYRALIEQLGLTQAELAGRLGEDRSSIANFVRLLELSEPVQQMVRSLKMSLGHAKILAGITDILEQQRLANLVASQELSVRNLERMVQGGSGDVPPARKTVAAAHLVDLEKTISRQIGMRVQIKSGKKGRGRLTVHFGSLDQFDELLARMGVKTE